MAAVTIEQAVRVAGEHRRAGRWREAEEIYRQVLAAQPENQGALLGLGLLAGQVERLDAAVEFFRKLAALCPGNVEVRCNLGEFLRRWGKKEEAVAAFREAIGVKGDYWPAHFNLGAALAELERWEEAAGSYGCAVALDGTQAETYVNWGAALEKLGRVEAAAGAYERALVIRPGLMGAHNNLGNILRGKGKWEEAAGHFRRMIEVDANCGEAYRSLGYALHEKGDLAEAAEALRKALALFPEDAELHNSLGTVLTELGELEEGAVYLRRAIALRPKFAAAHCNLGNVFNGQERLEEAIAEYRRAVELYGELGESARLGAERMAAALAQNNLGCALLKVGLVEEAMGNFERAMVIEPERADYETNRLLAMQYRAGFDEAAIFEAGRRWDEHHGAKGREEWGRYENERSAGRRLKIGYVSGDFRLHSVAFFLVRLLEERDRAGFHVTCYCNQMKADTVTERFRKEADEWREIAAWTDAEAAARIREDRIDILVDLTGHTGGSRLGIFTRKPAPVQVEYLGYPGTTGLAAMDYRLSDGWADPEAEGAEGDPYSTEKVVRLAPTAWCFEPLSGSPEVGELPALKGGGVTFGTFNNFAKVTEEMMGAWAEILRRVPGSRLLLKNAAMGHGATATRVREFFLARGVGAERLELVAAKKENLDHLREYRRVDVGLDTFPYHGTTTTCEALWMGVPVVTLAGRRHASRVGVSLLANVGLREMIAGSVEEYVGIAAGLAGDLGKLTELRRGLRERMRGSALMDGKRAAREVEAEFREMWGRWATT